MACASVLGGAVCAVSVAAPSTATTFRSSFSGSRVHVSSVAPAVKPLSTRSYRIVAMASPPNPAGLIEDLVQKIQNSIDTAKEVCLGGEDSEECAVAWDEVEELSAAQAHRRESGRSPSKDPLDKYCEDNPESDECRVYED